jgi:hypothetical protein
MKKVGKRISWFIGSLFILWGLLTLWVEKEGKAYYKIVGEAAAPQKAVIIFDPDPLSHFDEQVCTAFAQQLASHHWQVTLTSVKAFNRWNDSANLYVFCANTYNGSPDWSITRFIKKQKLSGKTVLALTLGVGFTNRSKQLLEQTLLDQNARIFDSQSFWSWRTNDKSRMHDNNRSVALDMAANWGEEIALKLK